MKEIKIQDNDVNKFIEFIKTLDSKSDNKSHDVVMNGYHVYVYEGEENGGGILHITKL